LLLAGCDEPRLSAVAQRIRQIAPGVAVELVVGDLGTDSDIDALAARLEDREIDVLVNNAGFGTYGRFSELDAAREHELVAVNVDSLVRLTHAVLPGMLARGRGAHFECRLHDRVSARSVSGHLRRFEGVRAFAQPGVVGRDTGIGCHRDRVVPGTHAHWIRRWSRAGCLTHRDLPAPGRARTGGRRGAARNGQRPCCGRSRVAISSDGHRRTAHTRLALGPDQRADVAPRRRCGGRESVRTSDVNADTPREPSALGGCRMVPTVRSGVT
jgi:short chain dehydrogenase